MSNIESEIYNLINEFFKLNGNNPTTVYLTPEKENELLLLFKYPIDKSSRELFKEKLYGFKIVWDSKKFYLE
jgi:hypothetical protein